MMNSIFQVSFCGSALFRAATIGDAFAYVATLDPVVIWANGPDGAMVSGDWRIDTRRRQAA